MENQAERLSESIVGQCFPNCVCETALGIQLKRVLQMQFCSARIVQLFVRYAEMVFDGLILRCFLQCIFQHVRSMLIVSLLNVGPSQGIPSLFWCRQSQNVRGRA